MRFTLGLIAIFIVSVIWTNSSRADSLFKAESEYEAGNFLAAYEIWIVQAESNEPSALSGLGQLYLFGQGVPKDEQYALLLIKKAAELGDARGKSGLGLIYLRGYGVPRDYVQAAYWLQKAADQDRHQAQYNLAWLYQYGLGVPQDLQKAAEWYARSSNLGNTSSMTQLSILYALGKGVEQDYLKSFDLAYRAAARGQIMAQNHLGDLYANGNGVNQNFEQAIYWYKRAAEKGNSYAESRLGYLYWNGYGVDIDYKLATEWYKKAAEKGDKYSIKQLGTSLLAGTISPKDEGAAIYWFRKGAEVNDIYSKAWLGYMYEFGLGSPKNDTTASYWYEQVLQESERIDAPISERGGSPFDFDSLKKASFFEKINRLPESFKAEGSHFFESNETTQERQAWNELTLFLTKTEKYRVVLSTYAGTDFQTLDEIDKYLVISSFRGLRARSIDELLSEDRLKRSRLKLTLAIAALDELYDSASTLDQLSALALEWLKIISVSLRYWDNKNNSGNEKLSLGTRLLSSYPQGSILHLRGSFLVWEYWGDAYYKSRSHELRLEADEILRELALGWLKPQALKNTAYFISQTDYIAEYCNVLAGMLSLYSSTPPFGDLNIARFNIRLYRTVLEDASHCATVRTTEYISIVRGLQTALTMAGEARSAFQLGEMLRGQETVGDNARDDIRSAISQSIERGFRLSSVGRDQEAFVEMIKARYLSKRYDDLGWTGEANRSLARILVRIGNPNSAISLVIQQLHENYNDTYSFCLDASVLSYAMKSSELSTSGIALLKACVDRFINDKNESPNVSYVDSILFGGFFKELEEMLIDAGRLAEAQGVMDIFSEQEYFDFIRRSSGVESRSNRIGSTPTEERWIARYREIADRLAAIGREEQDLQKQAKLGLSEEQKKRKAELAADLKVAQSAFESFLEQMRQEFAAKGPARSLEFAEISVKAQAELQELLKGLGDDVVLLSIRLSEEQVNFLVTTPSIQLARKVKIRSQDLARQVAQLNRLLRDPKSDPLPAAQALYKLLLAPVEQDLQQAGAKTVMLSLDGVLRYLPFGVLHDGQRYALQRWNLPTYTSVVRERLRDSANPNWQAAGLGVTRKHGNFDPLPGVRTEMSSIVRTGATGVLPGEVHLDEAFTAQRLKDVSQGRFPVVHVASHFQFSKRVGKASCPLTSTVSDGRGDRRPAMRQQFFDAAGRVCWQAIQDVAQVLIRVMPVELGRLNQAHRSGRTLTTA